MNFIVRPRTVVRTLGYFSLGFLFSGILSHQLKHSFGLLPGLAHWFNTDGEKNFPALFSCGLLLLSASLLLVITLAKRRERDRYTVAWSGLTVIFTGLAVDEWMSYHEQFTDIVKNAPVALPSDGIFHFAWIVAGIAFIAVIGFAYRNFLAQLPRQYARWFLAAAALYILGAIGLEMVAGYYADNHQQWNRLIWLGLTTVEEGLEMFGIITFIYALLHYIKNTIGDLNIHIEPAAGFPQAEDNTALLEPLVKK